MRTLTERERRQQDAIFIARSSRGLSQRQFGEMLGISHTSISYWETGMYVPSPRYLERMDRIFGEGWR